MLLKLLLQERGTESNSKIENTDEIALLILHCGCRYFNNDNKNKIF